MFERSVEEAHAFLRSTEFVWHQRVELAPGVFSPGVSDVAGHIARAGLSSVQGKSVLDIGTCNGGVLFELERLGASRLVGVDIYDQEWFGFADLRAFFRSEAEFIQTSVYGLDSALGERFDIVFFLGVLYHLRHPLLALDALHALTREYAVVETAILEVDVASSFAEQRVALFCRGNELNDDYTNWFIPTRATLIDWCESSGFSVVHSVDGVAHNRAVVGMTPTAGEPEYYDKTYERALEVRAHQRFGRS
jgi:tRNA (mo5U34)-methyltransferase